MCTCALEKALRDRDRSTDNIASSLMKPSVRAPAGGAGGSRARWAQKPRACRQCAEANSAPSVPLRAQVVINANMAQLVVSRRGVRQRAAANATEVADHVACTAVALAKQAREPPLFRPRAKAVRRLERSLA